MNPEELLRKRLARNRYMQLLKALKNQRLLDTAPRAAQYQGFQVDGGGIIDLLGGGRSILAPVTNGLVLPGQGVGLRKGSFDAAPHIRNEPVEPESKKETYPFVVLFTVNEPIENQPGYYYINFYVGGHKKQPELVFKINVSDINGASNFSYTGFVHNYGNRYEVSILYNHKIKGDIVVNIFGETDITEVQTITNSSFYSQDEYIPCLYKGNLIWQSYEFEPYLDTFNANINQAIPSLSVIRSEHYLSDSSMIYVASSPNNIGNRTIEKKVNYKLPFIDSKFHLKVRYNIVGDVFGRPDTGYKTWTYENLNLLIDWKDNFIYEKVNYEQRSELQNLPVGVMLGVGSTVSSNIKQYRPTHIKASQKYYLQSKSSFSPLELNSDKNVFIVLSSNKLNLASMPTSVEVKEGFPPPQHIVTSNYYPINNANYEFYPFAEYVGQPVLIAENGDKGCFLATGKVTSFTVTDEGKVLTPYTGDFYPSSINLQIRINIAIESINKVPYASFSSDKGTVVIHNGSFNSFLLSQINFSTGIFQRNYLLPNRYSSNIYMNTDSILDFSYHRARFEFFSSSIPIPLAEVQVMPGNNNFLRANKIWRRESVYIAQVPEEVKTKDSTGYAEEWKINQDGKIFRQNTVKSGKVYSLKNENAQILSISYYPV